MEDNPAQFVGQPLSQNHSSLHPRQSHFISIPNLVSSTLLVIPIAVSSVYFSELTSLRNWVLLAIFEFFIFLLCHSHLQFPTFLPNLFTPASTTSTPSTLSTTKDSCPLSNSHHPSILRAPPTHPPSLSPTLLTPKLSTPFTTTPLVSPTDSAIGMGTNTHVSGVPSQSLSPVATGWPLPSASSISTHRYESVCQNLIQTFLSYTLPSSSSSTSSTHSDAHWQLIVDRGSDVQIWRHCQNEHRYKIMGIVDAPLITTFDFLNDIEARPTWDDLTDTTQILEPLSTNARIQYIRVKPIWPTSARDLVVLACWQQVTQDQWMTCTTSIEHPLMPIQKNIVRMHAECAGQWCERITVFGKEKTKVFQLVDGNPGGWIPKSILTMVATKALPDSFLRVQSLVKQLPLSTHSKYFPTTECVPFIPSITLTSTSSPTLPMSTTTTTTTTTVSSSSSISYQDHPPPTDPDTQTPPFFSSPPPLHVASPRSRSRFPFMRSLFPPMVRRCMKYASPILFGLALMMFLAQRRQPGHFGGFRKLIHHVLLRWVRKV